MPSVIRIGDNCSGHECFSSRACTSGSSDVFVNGKGAHREGDSWGVHACTHPKMPHGLHGGTMAGGSATVYVNGKKIAREGDPVDCGSNAGNGSPNVFAGG